MMAKRWNPIQCPCCGKPARIDPNHPPLSQEENLRLNSAPSWWSQPGWTLRWAKDRKLYWACQKCFRTGHALEAKPWLQTYLDFPPRFAYFDIKKRCEDCNKRFIFNSAEQYKWYEQYKFWVQSEPKQCLSCRRVRRQRARTEKALALALSELDPKDPLQLAPSQRSVSGHWQQQKVCRLFVEGQKQMGGIEALESLIKSNK